MDHEDASVEEFIEKAFQNNGGDYTRVINSLSAELQKKLKRHSHFYFYICKFETREELKLIGMVSLIEDLMGDEYLDPFEFFDLNYKGKNGIDDFNQFRERYLAKFGTTRKFKEYFEQYLSENAKEKLPLEIKKWNNRKKIFVALKNIQKVAEVFYTMRSDFVHKARMSCFCPSNCGFAGGKVGENFYTIETTIDSVLRIFEESFVNYWVRKINSCIP